MTSLVVSQPMLLPWRGLFEQMQLADVFVFYDDVQLPLGGGSGRGFITRVQIKASTGPTWLHVPIRRAELGAQAIKDARFADLHWKRKHLAAFQLNYGKSPWYQDVMETLVHPIYARDTNHLSEFCTAGMRLIASRLGIAPVFHVSSLLGVTEDADPSERLLSLCRYFGATEYITGHGAGAYLRHDIFESAGVSVRYADYTLRPYPQRFGPFTPYVSVLDLLFNVGDRASEYLEPRTVDWRCWLERKNRRTGPG